MKAFGFLFPNAFYYTKKLHIQGGFSMSAVVAMNEETRRMEQFNDIVANIKPLSLLIFTGVCFWINGNLGRK